jgi:DNA polymerase-3 subunit gamma/tau
MSGPERMQNFIVSARKYRPQTFDTVVGQPSITNTLKNAIRNNQLAQAFLFCGPRGVGKTTCARILAKTINCDHPGTNGDACDQCPSCLAFNESASFNIYELDGASSNSVDDIRSLIDQVRIPPQMGRYKVYIIDEVHMLSASAFNAFLKTLEEPPSYAKFILATTEKHKIIPTVLSRCQIFDFKRITIDDIVTHLMFVASHENIRVEEEALHIIAQKADGAMRDALSIFDQLVSFTGDELAYATVLENLNVLDYDYYFRITGQILAGDVSGTLLTINDILDKGFDGQHFLVGFGEHIRNLLVSKDPATVRLLEATPNIRQRYLEQSVACDAAYLIKILDISNRSDLSYKASNHKRLHLELALMQMCSLSVAVEPSLQPAPQIPPPSVPSPVKKPVPPVKESAKPAEKEPVPVKIKDIGGSFKGTTSIKPEKKTGPAEQPIPAENLESLHQKPFSGEELIAAWNEFAGKIRPEFPHLASTLKLRAPVVTEDFVITFGIENRVLEEELNQRRSDLLDFLRKRLENDRITLITQVLGNHTVSKPYTDKEKFDQMAAKNPVLHKLREQLDLDIEF